MVLTYGRRIGKKVYGSEFNCAQHTRISFVLAAVTTLKPRLLPPSPPPSFISLMSSPKIHPATLVTNIKNCVPIQLDDEGTHFNTWCTLFKLHCHAHLVDDHIIAGDDSKTSSTDPEWQRLDDIVRPWLYATITQFNDIKLCDFSNVKAYCTKLNNIATTLNNLGTSITDDHLAMQLLRGLSKDY
ncbi:uncharacterized protein LOC130807045 [Amaranthus tricolor]|uniref:uncharacterized protein LOC130807045 n=1 Tax=Amaranthus tricolor TaxID=29722 RepID=UPI002582B432|nr:uncharacterized protein LOC130807045 [Amaranthus tricolor]